jgi:hypothetical protein
MLEKNVRMYPGGKEHALYLAADKAHIWRLCWILFIVWDILDIQDVLGVWMCSNLIITINNMYITYTPDNEQCPM